MRKILIFIFCLFICGGVLAAKKVDYQKYNYSSIDRYVLRAPIVKDKGDMQDLVDYLTKPFHDGQDIEKARALFAWVVYNVDYDDYEARYVEKTVKKGEAFEYVGNIWETRSGVCRDIALMYVQMADAAKLKTELVPGTAGRDLNKKNAELNQHVWVAVMIDDEWEFVDPTWAIEDTPTFESVNNNRSYRKNMKARLKDDNRLVPRKQRKIGNEWFLPDKDEFIKTHYPEDDRWQLQKKKVSYKKFLLRSSE